MSMLADWEIKERVHSMSPPMIEPFADGSPPGVVSYGLSSYGYDVRLGNHFRVFDSWTKMHGGVIDPKSQDWHECFTGVQIPDGESILIQPNSFVLGESLETFNIPRDVLAVVVGKSTYARCAVLPYVTPLEPEWRGKITVEISNAAPLPARLYAGEGIAQVIFLCKRDGALCLRSYADKKGRYQDQKGLTMPFVKR